MINIEVRICLTAISVRAVDNEKSVQDNINRNSFDDMFAVRRVLRRRRYDGRGQRRFGRS